MQLIKVERTKKFSNVPDRPAPVYVNLDNLAALDIDDFGVGTLWLTGVDGGFTLTKHQTTQLVQHLTKLAAIVVLKE